MDDFEKAILFSFDQSGAVDAQLKERAIAYCNQAKLQPQPWRLCLQRLISSQYAEVQFWCLQTLEEIIRGQYLSLDSSEKLFIRSGVLSAIIEVGEIDARPVFVKNKLAQILVLLVYIEYPNGWPSVFVDLLQALSRGVSVVDMFIRVLIDLDAEVVSLDFPRSPDEIAVSNRIKDALRGQCIGQILEACYSLVVAYKSVNPTLAAATLEAVQKYVAWVDIGLVANERFVPLLFGFLASAAEPFKLRGAASDCLLAIVSKKMDGVAKLALLRRLQIVEVCKGLTDVKDAEFALKLTELLTGLAEELLECHRKIEVSTSTDAAEKAGALAAVTEMMDDVLPAVFYFLEHGDEDISSTTFQFLQAYVGRIKRGSQLSKKQGEHLSQLLGVLRSRMRYEDGAMGTLEQLDAKAAEEEDRMAEYRRDLFIVLRSISKIAPEVTRGFVQSNLLTVLGNKDASAEDVEGAVQLLYQLGEQINEETLKSGPGGLGDMLEALLSSKVPHHAHRVIAQLYLETVVRYVRFVEQRPQYIPPVLSVFLDARGVHHPDAGVRSRASYLFMRLVKVLRLQLQPFVDTILQSLEDLLEAITTSESVPSKGDGTDERLYIFEAIGLLVGVDEVPSAKQQEYLTALLGPLFQQLESVLASIPAGDLEGPATAVNTLQQVILAIAYLSKGFGEHLAANKRPEIGANFKQALEKALKALQRLPKNKSLRSRVISFVHRMVECLGTNIFPLLPAAIQQLLVDCEAKDMMEFIQLANQLMAKFKAAVSPLLVELLPAIVARVFALVPDGGLPEGPGTNTEDIREQRDLYRLYLTFIQTITANALTSAFLTPQNSQCLTKVMTTLVEGARAHADMTVRKICLQCLVKFAQEWCGSGAEPEKVPGFRRFVIEQVGPECCIYSMMRPAFNLRDASSVVLFGEIVSAQKALYEKCGDDFLVHLATVALPAVHCPSNVAEQYCLHLQRSDVKQIKAFLKPVIEQLRPLQNGSLGYG
ncbi:tRNA exportin [Klebsormidium nitens]|uniref:Exportin-T n=1 Tax=Klebsormidium nitens TaxID=105231 RepID=A0A1Y1IKH1_KLENI|nr:tRNA exportin [Klebsormidium nitens]|eukprot:GAQ89651.1 tRNA exportin [Klebsormidium nitens]